MRNENQPVSKSSHNAAKTALEGFKVLDLCQVLAGPIGARILSEYGAKVIKINNPRQFENPTGMAGHETVNCGKLTSFIDLKSDEGRSLMRELISEADVFHCNFAQETFTRLGIDENSIREINPNIVFSQVNVHSIGGWRENYRGHEELGEAVSGMEERYGNSYSGATLPITICDNSTGCMSALGMLLALYHRERTGEGIYVQASLSRSAGYLQIPYMIDFSGKLWNEPRGKKVKGWSAINRLYKTADGWIFICAEKDPSAICSVSGLEDIDITSDNLADILEERFALESAGIWVNRLSAVNIAARQSRDFCDDAMTEAYAIERGLSVCREHRGIGKIRVIGCAPRLSDTPAKPAFAVAAKGEDTKTVETFRWQWEIPNN